MKLRKTQSVYYFQNHPISKILHGPALVIIGSQSSIYRHQLMEQMACDIATGRPFLGGFETQQRPVLICRAGEADYSRTVDWTRKLSAGEDPQGNLTIRRLSSRISFQDPKSRKPTASKDLFQELEDCLDETQVEVIFLPDFLDLTSTMNNYLRHFEIGPSDDDFKINKITFDMDISRELYRRMFLENVRRLSQWTYEKETVLVIGDQINQFHKFDGNHFLERADILIRLIKQDNAWKLNLDGKSHRVSGNTFELSYNDEKFVLSEGEFESRVLTFKNLSPQQEKILELLKFSGPLSHKEIHAETGIPKPTISKSLKVLLKRRIVLSLPGRKFSTIEKGMEQLELEPIPAALTPEESDPAISAQVEPDIQEHVALVEQAGTGKEDLNEP